MRDIKFRAWDSENKRMLDVTQVTWSVQNKGRMEVYSVGKINNPTLLQYTGLHDKNGKEIYEGDIVKHSSMDTVFFVEWDSTLTGFELFYWQKGVKRKSVYVISYQLNGERFEVIGNIYENPELLIEKEGK